MAEQLTDDAAEWLVRSFLPAAVTWPQELPAALDTRTLRDCYRGCLLWGAVGDALGFPVEGWRPEEIRARFGPAGVVGYGRAPAGGPAGLLSDDTQLTMEVARSLLATGGALDAEDFARRLVAWLPIGRSRGQATTIAVEALSGGEPWWQAGRHMRSAGNGAAMRAAPVGLAWALAPDAVGLVRDAILSALPTHTHPVGVAGAVVIAAGVAWCVRERLRGATQLDPGAFLAFVTGAITGMEPEPTAERRPGGKAVRLAERIAEIATLLTWPSPEAVFAYTWSGAFALESVPAALYCFLRAPDNPRQVVLTAVNGGFDCDTIASMAGNLAGAWCGAARLREQEPAWLEGLEERETLVALADALAEVAQRRRA